MTTKSPGMGARARVVLATLVVVFAVEMVLMLVLPALHLAPGSVAEALTDATVLTFAIVPFLIWQETRRARAEAFATELAALVTQAEDIVVGATFDGIIRSWNGAAERNLGYPAADAIGKSATLFLPPDLQHQVGDLFGLVKAGERISQFETVAVRRDGSRFDVSASLAPITDDTGRRIAVAVTARDISAKKGLREEQSRLIRELQDSLETVRTLRGLLPICSACKKIRNEEGGWEQVELYVRSHSEAEFSHGICPECAQRLYGLYADAGER